MIWATVSSRSGFCWLYRASPSLAAKNIINLILVLSIWWRPCVESSLVLLEAGVCYDKCKDPVSGSLLMSHLFPTDGQCIGASASFPLRLTGLISLKFKGLSRVFSNTTAQNHQFFNIQPSLWSNSHTYDYWKKTTALTRWSFVGKVMSLVFNTLSRFIYGTQAKIWEELAQWGFLSGHWDIFLSLWEEAQPACWKMRDLWPVTPII